MTGPSTSFSRVVPCLAYSMMQLFMSVMSPLCRKLCISPSRHFLRRFCYACKSIPLISGIFLLYPLTLRHSRNLRFKIASTAIGHKHNWNSTIDAAMECLHLPRSESGKRRPMLPSIPLVAKQRWDGGPFLEYPQRRGFQAMYDGAGGTTEYPWEISPAAQQLSTKELEAFFQEWLLFGLITEALDGNSETLGSSPLPAAQQTNTNPAQEHNNAASIECHTHGHCQTIVDRVYRDFVYQADAKSYITTRIFTSELQNSWSMPNLSFYPTRNHLAVRYKRMRLCLRQAHYFYTHLPADFGSDIKFSIGAIAETIAHAMQLVCHYLDLEGICPNQWGDGYYADKKVKSRMVKRGWCLTDLAISTHKFKFLQTLH